jgi:hypothetical protein
MDGSLSGGGHKLAQKSEEKERERGVLARINGAG